jgi:lysophospholipase L1-like esterase
VRVLAVNVILTIALLGAIELVVRLTNPDITPLGTDAALISDSIFADVQGPTPGASGRSNGAHFQVDEDGFWEYGTPRETDAPIWLLIGDSVTMGIGVQPDSTFAGILSEYVAGRFNILNPALIGHSSRDYLKLVHYFVTSSLREDLLVSRITIFWCLNDVYSGRQIESPGAGLRQVLEPVLSLARRHWFTYQWLKALLLDRPQRYYSHDGGFYEGATLKRAASDLSAIDELCNLHVVDCDLILLPYEYQLREHVFEPQRKLTAHLETVSLFINDASPWLLDRTTDPAELYLYGDGIHFSAKGHRLLADYVVERVAQR